MIVFGGAGGSTYNDVWALSLSGTHTWTNLTPTGPAPVARRGHTAIHDSVRDRMLVFGGNDASLVDHSDAWALSLSGGLYFVRLRCGVEEMTRRLVRLQ